MPFHQTWIINGNNLKNCEDERPFPKLTTLCTIELLNIKNCWEDYEREYQFNIPEYIETQVHIPNYCIKRVKYFIQWYRKFCPALLRDELRSVDQLTVKYYLTSKREYKYFKYESERLKRLRRRLFP